jgi:hypothetical protein
MLKPALDLLAGQSVFRDTFSQYGVGLHYMQAATLWPFGPTLRVMRLGAVAIYALTAGLLVSAWRLLVPRGLVLLALGLWLALPGFYDQWFSMQAWSSVYALLLSGNRAAQPAPRPAGMDAIVQRSPQRHRVRPRVLLPAARRRRDVGGGDRSLLLGGMGLCRSIPRSPSARRVCDRSRACPRDRADRALARRSLHEWYVQTIDWPRHWAFGDPQPVWKRLTLRLLPFPSGTLPWLAVVAAALLPLRRWDRAARSSIRGVAIAAYVTLVAAAAAVALLLDPTHLFRIMWIWTGLPTAILLFTVWAVGVPLWSRRVAEPRDVAAAGAALVALVSWFQYFPAFSPQHIFWSLAPGLRVAMYVAWYASGRRTLATALVVGVLVSPFVTEKMRQARAKLAESYVRLQAPSVLEGMWVLPRDALEWQRLSEKVDAALRRRPDAPMLVEGRDALFSVLVTNRRNPGPFYIDWRMPGVDLEAERAAFIARECPLIFQQQPALPLVQQAIAAGRYRRIYDGPWGALLEPAEPVGLPPP